MEQDNAGGTQPGGAPGGEGGAPGVGDGGSGQHDEQSARNDARRQELADQAVATGRMTREQADNLLATGSMKGKPQSSEAVLAEANKNAAMQTGSMDELRRIADTEVAAGRMTREQADGFLAMREQEFNKKPGDTTQTNDQSKGLLRNELGELGFSVDGLPELDLNNIEVKAEHDAFTEQLPPGKPYKFKYPINGEINQKFVSEMQGLARDMGLPPVIAEYASSKFVKVEEGIIQGKVTEDTIQLDGRKNITQLEKIWGDRTSPEFKANLKAAKSVINHMPPERQEQVKKFMDITGLGNDVILLSMFAKLARHRAAAKSFKKGI